MSLAVETIALEVAPRRPRRTGVRIHYCFYGFALKKSFAIGTMIGMRSIKVTCVVLGSMANLDAERGRMSPKISSPFRRNISAM
jgi:hypothetical protein